MIMISNSINNNKMEMLVIDAIIYFLISFFFSFCAVFWNSLLHLMKKRSVSRKALTVFHVSMSFSHLEQFRLLLQLLGPLTEIGDLSFALRQLDDVGRHDADDLVNM